MSNAFENAILPNKLMPILGDFDNNHVGYVYSIDFQTATVLTNDAAMDETFTRCPRLPVRRIERTAA